MDESWLEIGGSDFSPGRFPEDWDDADKSAEDEESSEHGTPNFADEEIDDEEVARVLSAAMVEDSKTIPASDSTQSVAAAMHPLVHERILRRRTMLQMPWEKPFYSSIFGSSAVFPTGVSDVGIGEILSSHLQSVPVEAPSRVSKFVAKRLRMIPLIQSEDQMRWRALSKMRMLVLADPTSSSLGRSLLDIIGRLVPEEEIRQTFNDAFACKSTGTLVRRVGPLVRFGDWVVSHNYGNPLSFTEPVIYQYVTYLRVTGAAPTAADSFLQSVNFACATCGIPAPDGQVLISARVKGSADEQFSKKRKLVQATPLSREMVWTLERRACDDPSEYLTLVAGHLCFCLFACCRFSDSMKLEGIRCDSHAGVTLIEGKTAKHKTATNKERKTTFLPLFALGKGIYDGRWGENWVAARNHWLESTDLVLPAMSEVSGRLLSRPLTTAEAAIYLHQILDEGEISEAQYSSITTHSLKVTLLSWCSMSARVSFSDRRLIGHHMAPGQESVLTYSREEMLRLMAVVYNIIEMVRCGTLDPDAPRVHQLARLLKKEASVGLDQDDVDSGLAIEDQEVADGDCNEEDLQQSDDSWDEPFREEGHQVPVGKEVLIHTFSKVAHIDAGNSKLMCGRALNRNYQEVSERMDVSSIPMCAQCNAAHKSRKQNR